MNVDPFRPSTPLGASEGQATAKNLYEPINNQQPHSRYRSARRQKPCFLGAIQRSLSRGKIDTLTTYFSPVILS